MWLSTHRSNYINDHRNIFSLLENLYRPVQQFYRYRIYAGTDIVFLMWNLTGWIPCKLASRKMEKKRSIRCTAQSEYAESYESELWDALSGVTRHLNIHMSVGKMLFSSWGFSVTISRQLWQHGLQCYRYMFSSLSPSQEAISFNPEDILAARKASLGPNVRLFICYEIHLSTYRTNQYLYGISKWMPWLACMFNVMRDATTIITRIQALHPCCSAPAS